MAPPQRRYVHSRLHFHFFLKRSVAEDAAAATATCVAITVTRLTAVITVITTVSTITVTKAKAKMLHSLKRISYPLLSYLDFVLFSLGIVRDIIPPIIGDNQAGFFLVIKLIRCDVTSQFQDRTHRHKRHKDCSHSQHELERGETNWI